LKLHLPFKIFLAFFALSGLYFFFSRDDQYHPYDKLKPVSTPVASTSTESSGFEIDDVKSFEWSFFKSHIKWPVEEKTLDSFEVRRHLLQFSKLNKKINASEFHPEKRVGEILIHFKDSRVLKGSYDEKMFVWTEGKLKNLGAYFLTKDGENSRDLLFEGPLGLQIHVLKLCDPLKLINLEFANGAKLSKSIRGWMIFQKKDLQGISGTADLANTEEAFRFLKKLCSPKIDFFKPFLQGVTGLKLSSELEMSSKTLKSVNASRLLKNNETYFFSQGGHSESVSFTSKDLSDILKINLETLKDLSVQATRDFLDSTKSQIERLEAIRKVKKLKSQASVPDLRKLVFEDTDIDVYRYEAVDALAEIGSKEAFRVIGERLKTVKRSGFQLRLARALANAMGDSFSSDENTAEDVRQPEVKELLEEFEKNPPGK
jgi:hypothetical protein